MTLTKLALAGALLADHAASPAVTALTFQATPPTRYARTAIAGRGPLVGGDRRLR
jgi:hypothetical protein